MSNPPSRKHLQSPDPPPVHASEVESNNCMEGLPESKRQRHGPTVAITTLINQQEMTTQKAITPPDTCTAQGNGSMVGGQEVTRGIYNQHLSVGEVPMDCASPDSVASPAWQHTIEKTVLAVVAVHFSQVTAFDTEPPYTSQASGFIVDAERGIILTNRHVVGSGPFVGEVVMHDHEEVDVYPLYRDPIHDFGFLRFDPKAVKYMPIHEIPLTPERAKVGLDIRVVGNDAGEKLSILSGSISRLDRNAPEYGELTYNDFNTFYLQAASSSSGGSSGSPVIDVHGNAIGLQAGGSTHAATNFFFPLNRVKYALEKLQAGCAVPRGTIQTHFLYRPFDEVRRLGLRADTEALIRQRFPDDIGMLVVETVLPEGPAADFLEEGDVIIAINDKLITQFVPLEALLDESVGQTLQFRVERGGVTQEFSITIQDLHSITPDRLLKIGGAILNNLSYQLARNYNVPTRGVYLSEAGGMFDFGSGTTGCIIQSVDDRPTPDLETFKQVMLTISDRAMVKVVYYSIEDVHTLNVRLVHVDRHWSEFQVYIRNDRTGLWDVTTLPPPPPALVREPETAQLPQFQGTSGPGSELINSLVRIRFETPLNIEGYPYNAQVGMGVVWDASRGLVVVSRAIVPHSLGDVTVTIAQSIVLPGKILYSHPVHNISVVSYDPQRLHDTPIQSIVPSETPLEPGQAVHLVGFNRQQRPMCISTSVTDISTRSIPDNLYPRYRGLNFESVHLDTTLTQEVGNGMIVDPQGKVQGLLLRYLGEQKNRSGHRQYVHGLDIRNVLPVMTPLVQGVEPQLRVLNVELATTAIAQARLMGLPDEWVQRVEAANPYRRQLYIIRRIETNSPCARLLKELDVILTVNGRIVTTIADLDDQYHQEELTMEVLREKRIHQLSVPTAPAVNGDTKRVALWAGAVIQPPHRAVLQQSKLTPSMVYVTSVAKGSPASQYGLYPSMWITQVNGQPTPDLDAFISATRNLPDNTYVRIKATTFDLLPTVLSVKTCLHYWSTVTLTKDDSTESGWQFTKVSP
ncbi:hypothetical protein IWQ62_003831 [Dispira parvispora]|uniref:PDZ domain-containing protein n=1 Tax=Dispira parvispora TaxID=1520584 RepID=A0A9W8E5Y8_9FUNG|nr:hypothetical protein IWQ62_003831 [Dispira parvispora]